MDTATDSDPSSLRTGNNTKSSAPNTRSNGDETHDQTRASRNGDSLPLSEQISEDDLAETPSAAETERVASPASVTSPPYWMQLHAAAASSSPSSHRRSGSNVSADSALPAGAITMRDNEAVDRDGRNKACWAKSVEVTNYVVVNGSATNIGAFVVWNIRVETLQGSYMDIRKRYSEFDDLRHQLTATFPDFDAAVPPLPPKSVISKFRPAFLNKRRQGLQYFLNCIMLNPEFSGSPVLKEFLFS